MRTEEFPLVIISCGSDKHAVPSRAEDLYKGAFFRVCLNYAKTLTVPERIMILSAKYGFVSLDDVIAPYNMKMGSKRAVEVRDMKRQARELGIIDEKKVIAIGGVLYTGPCRKLWKFCRTPLQEGRGTMGMQMKWMKEQIESSAEVPLGARAFSSFSKEESDEE